MLQIKIFTLRFSDATDDFLNQDELNAFISDKEIVDVKEEFFIKGNIPYLSVIIKYLGVSSETFTVKQDTIKGARKDKYSSILTEESRPGLMKICNFFANFLLFNCTIFVPPFSKGGKIEMKDLLKYHAIFGVQLLWGTKMSSTSYVI